MNWYTVRLVAVFAVFIGAVVSFACMMANGEYGTSRSTAGFAVLTGSLITAFALLLGSVT